MRNKLCILLICIFGLTTYNAQAQNYNSAIGLKLGYGLVASYKTFLNEKSALDLFAGLRWGGLAAGAYYEMHYDLGSVDRLQWYWGGGASFTTWDYGGFINDTYFEFGIAGVLGLDYSFDNIPLNLSADWAPTVVIFDSWDNDLYGSLSRFRSGYGALTARYILK